MHNKQNRENNSTLYRDVRNYAPPWTVVLTMRDRIRSTSTVSEFCEEYSECNAASLLDDVLGSCPSQMACACC